MHEMSIALNIMEILREEVAKENGRPLQKVTLAVGELSGIEPESLRFFLDTAFEEEKWRDVTLEIKQTPLAAHCRTCGADFKPEETDFRCACGSSDIELTGGQSLHIESIVLDRKTIG